MTLRDQIAGFLPFRKPSTLEATPVDTSSFTEVPAAADYVPSVEDITPEDEAFLNAIVDSLVSEDAIADVSFWHPQTYIDTASGIYEGRASVAFAAYDDALLFGASFCSPNDQFSRPAGRNLALQRLQEDPYIIETPRLLDTKEARRVIAGLISAGNELGIPGYPHSQKIMFVSGF